MTRVVKILMTIHFLIFGALGVYATEYYISPDGKDSNVGTLTFPWRSIQRANESLRPGDTVYLREGYYTETIRPTNSGTPANSITYSGYQSEKAVIYSRPEGAQLTGKQYITIKKLHFETCHYFIRSYPDGFDHCIIEDCIMEDQTGWCGIEIGDGSTYNRVRRNYVDSNFIEGDCIHIGKDEVGEQWGAQYNIVEGNEVMHAKHGGITCAGDKTRFNIIRNNYVHDIGDNCLATGALVAWVLIEGNRIHNPGIDADGASGIQIRSEYTIVRRNIMTHNADIDIDLDAAGIVFQATNERPYVRYNKTYSNVIYNFDQPTTPWHGIKLAVYTSIAPFGPNIFKNNIIYKNGINNSLGFQVFYSRVVQNSPSDEFHSNLIRASNDNEQVIYFFEYSNQRLMLDQAEQAYPYIFKDTNIDMDPMFVNEAGNNFELQAGSPCIDGGSFLTRTTTSGNGYQIFVEDAQYFCDGWFITDGDIIRVGSNEPVQILNIDYNSNIIEIDRDISWEINDGVSLNFYGSAPDIGAFEYYIPPDYSAPAPPSNIIILNP